MAAYNVTLSDGVTIITVPDGGIYNTYSIPIIGQNATTYGDDMAAAQLRHLENFASSDAPDVNLNIPGGALLTGQLWYDTGTGTLKVWTGSAWVGFLKDTGNLSAAGDILPAVNNTYDIGSTSLRWAEGWFTNLTAGGTTALNTATVSSLTSTTSSLGTASAGTLTMSGIIITDASDSSAAGLRIPHGAAPSSPTNGDIWSTTGGVFFRRNGSTVQLAEVGPASGVTSFNGRTGAVTPQEADYASFFASTAGNESISGEWTFNQQPNFNGGTSGVSAPFNVDSTFLVTNLNADYLDGQHGSFYATNSAVVHLTGTETVAGQKTFTSPLKSTAGAEVVRLVSNATQGYISFYDSNDSTLRFLVGRTGSAQFAIQNLQSVGVVDVHGNNNYLRIRASDQVTFYAGASTTGSEGAGGTQQITSSATSRLWVAGPDGAVRNVGFNETATVFLNSSRDVANTDIGQFLTRTTSSSVSLTLINLTTAPTGASFLVHNNNGSGTLTINRGSSNLYWIKGDGLAPANASRTLAYNGLCTIRKAGVNEWYIWGTGLS